MIVDMISSLGRSVIKFFRALGRSGFMLFGALVGKHNFVNIFLY